MVCGSKLCGLWRLSTHDHLSKKICLGYTVETGYKDTAYKNNSVIRSFFPRTKSFRTFYSKNKPAIKSEKPDIRSFLGQTNKNLLLST